MNKFNIIQNSSLHQTLNLQLFQSIGILGVVVFPLGRRVDGRRRALF